MSDITTITVASATPTIDAIVLSLMVRDNSDETTTSFHTKGQPTTSKEGSETTVHPKPTLTSSHPKPSSPFHESATSKATPSTSHLPTTLSTKVSKSSSSSSTASYNPYPYPIKANSVAPSQPSASTATEKKLAALRKSNTDLGIIVAVFVICFVLMAAFQIWYWCVFKPKRKALSKGIELATGGKSNGRSWFGRKVAKKVVERYI